MPLTGYLDSTSDPTWLLAATRALLAQQLAAMALRTAVRRRCSVQRHGRARGRGKRGRKLPPTPPELWEPLGSAPSRALPTPGLELADRPDDAWQLSRRSAVAASPFPAMERSDVVRMTSRQWGEAQSSVFAAAA